MSFQKPPKLFIAYSHKDESFKNELTKWLKPLEQQNKIEVLHDGELVPGDKWQEVRYSYLHNADVVLYLVSPYSLASVECNKEIANTLNNQKRFVPIILRECDWKKHEVSGSSITDFQALPKDGKPIKSWKDKDEAWQNVIDGFHKILDSAEEQEDTPQNTLFELGNAKYMLGALDEALVAYTEAIELKPDYVKAYNNRGILFSDIKQYDKAEKDFKKAMELKPDFADAYISRGILFYTLKQYDKAEKDFNKAIELKPDYVKAYNNRGILFYTLKQYAKAEADYNRAIELKPDDADVYNNRGILFSDLKQYDKAEADYNRAIELKPDDADVYNNRGILFRALEQYDKAEADYNRAIELKPDYVKAYNNRGILFSDLKQYDKAEKDFNKAIKLKPDYVDAHNNRAISMAKKNAKETQKKYEKEIKKTLKPITSLIDHAEKINEREEEYKKELVTLDKLISSCTSDITKLILTSLVLIALTGYHLLNVTEIQSPFTVTAIVFAALAIASPSFWHLRNLFERRRVLQICIEDYWRKRMLTSLALSMENSDVKQYLAIETHRHFMNNSTADLLFDLLAPRNSKKTQHKEMEPLDIDKFAKIMQQVINRENK